MQRRKLSFAGVSPEQADIIGREEPPKKPVSGGTAVLELERPEEGSPPVVEPEQSREKTQAPASQKERTTRRRPRKAKVEAAPVEAEKEVVLMTQTFRLPSSIVESLLRVSMERKLKKMRPYTQQDIVAEALSEWLSSEGAL